MLWKLDFHRVPLYLRPDSKLSKWQLWNLIIEIYLMTDLKKSFFLIYQDKCGEKKKKKKVDIWFNGS